MIYLDYAATTPVAREVLTVITQALQTNYANPSSSYQAGKHNRHLLNEARHQLKQYLQIDEGELYFTSGATESNNWAIISQANRARELGYGNHIVSTAIEHPSVLEVLRFLETQGYEITYLNPVEGQYEATHFIEASHEKTIGWVAMWINNELGTKLPIESIGTAARKYVQWFHVDAVQAFGQGPINLSLLQATSISASGHKLYAPKGIGLLYYHSWSKEMILQPLLHGGGQEKAMRSGTENLPYILGLVKAFELATTIDIKHFEELSNYLFEQLNAHQIDVERNGKHSLLSPAIINLYFPHLLASQLLIHLDLSGIAISAGSACSAGSLEVSHVLKAYYPQEDDRYQKSIRISFGKATTKEDIRQLVKVIKQLNERTK